MNAAVRESPKSNGARLTRGFTIIHLPPAMRDNNAVTEDLQFILDTAPGGRPEDVLHVLLGDVYAETGNLQARTLGVPAGLGRLGVRRRAGEAASRRSREGRDPSRRIRHGASRHGLGLRHVSRAGHGQLMERDLTYVALDAIAFVTGATLSAMLGHMQYRVDRATGRMSGYLLLWVLGFIWTFGNFLRCTLELAGASSGLHRRAVRGDVCLELHAARPARHRPVGAGWHRIDEPRRRRDCLAFTVAVSVLNLVLIVRANHLSRLSARGQRLSNDFVLHRAGGRHHRVCHLSTRTEARRPRRRTMPRWFAPAALLFAAIHTSAILLSMLVARHAGDRC